MINYPSIPRQPHCRPILQAVLETFAVIVQDHSNRFDGGFQIVGLMQVFDYHWPDFLDRRYQDQYDVHAEAVNRRAALDRFDVPDDWVDLNHPPSRLRTCGRILLQCVPYVSPLVLAEAAVIISLSHPDNAQLQRLEMLTRDGWQQLLASRYNWSMSIDIEW